MREEEGCDIDNIIDSWGAVESPPARWTLALIAISTAVRLVVAAVVPLTGDEAYYWHLGVQFHLSYFDHPPLAYWMAALGTAVGAPSWVVVVRLPFVLLFSASTWLMFLIGRRLFGGSGSAGFFAALLMNLTVYFALAAGTLALPEGPLAFCWLASLWFLCRILFDRAEPDLLCWLGLGVSLGLAGLAKFHAIFIPLGAAVALAVVPALRRRAWSVGLVLAVVVAAVVWSPVFIWNARHGWISFAYQLGRGTQFVGIAPLAAVKSLGGQSLLMMPWIWLLLVWALVRGFVDDRRAPVGRFLSSMAVVPIAAFTLLAVFNGQWDMFHWAAVGYLSLFPAAGAALDAALHRGAASVQRLLALSSAAMLATCGAILLYCASAFAAPLHEMVTAAAPRSYLARNYDFFVYDGVEQALARRGLLGMAGLFVVTDDYMDSGRLAWTLRGRVPVLCFAPDDAAKGYPFRPQATGWKGATGIAVARDADVARDLALFRPYFRRITDLGAPGPHLHLLRLDGMRRPFAFTYGPRATN